MFYPALTLGSYFIDVRQNQTKRIRLITSHTMIKSNTKIFCWNLMEKPLPSDFFKTSLSITNLSRKIKCEYERLKLVQITFLAVPSTFTDMQISLSYPLLGCWKLLTNWFCIPHFKPHYTHQKINSGGIISLKWYLYIDDLNALHSKTKNKLHHFNRLTSHKTYQSISKQNTSNIDMWFHFKSSHLWF